MVKNESRKTQKLIIPQGTIDPSDTAIIEIPLKLHSQPIVIAKRRDSQRSIAPSIVFDDEDLKQSSAAGGGGRGRSEMASLDSAFKSYPQQNSSVDGPKFSSTRDYTPTAPILQKQSNRGESVDVGPGANRGGVTEDRVEQSTTFSAGPSSTIVPTVSQISGRYNFQTCIPQQSFCLSCDIADDNPEEVDDVEKAERTLILNELQKYHDARRKYLMSLCEQAEQPEVKRVASVCKKPPCRTCELPVPPVPKSCLSTRSTAPPVAREFKLVGSDAHPQKVPQGRAIKSIDVSEVPSQSGSKLGEKASGVKICIPTLLSTSDIQRIRQQFQDATKKLEKAMACMPCNSDKNLV